MMDVESTRGWLGSDGARKTKNAFRRRIEDRRRTLGGVDLLFVRDLSDASRVETGDAQRHGRAWRKPSQEMFFRVHDPSYASRLVLGRT